MFNSALLDIIIIFGIVTIIISLLVMEKWWLYKEDRTACPKDMLSEDL